MQLVRDLINLCKPGILLLLVITSGAAQLLAGSQTSVYQFIMLAIGGALMSASGAVFNCIFDRDIDAIMKRTMNRPLPAGRIGVQAAVVWGAFLGITGYLLLRSVFNPLTANLALAGGLFYVVIYTLLLKRHTVQNIVIGGAAGAFPPLVGWASVTGELSLAAWLLFAVIFLWTPPHFWALALKKNEDYQRANIPMMPVIKGFQRTKIEMLIYGILLCPVTAWLIIVLPEIGLLSILSLSVINTIFVYKLYLLYKDNNSESAMNVFYFSLLYLACFFSTLVIDSRII